MGDAKYNPFVVAVVLQTKGGRKRRISRKETEGEVTSSEPASTELELREIGRMEKELTKRAAEKTEAASSSRRYLSVVMTSASGS